MISPSQPSEPGAAFSSIPYWRTSIGIPNSLSQPHFPWVWTFQMIFSGTSSESLAFVADNFNVTTIVKYTYMFKIDILKTFKQVNPLNAHRHRDVYYFSTPLYDYSIIWRRCFHNLLIDTQWLIYVIVLGQHQVNQVIWWFITQS